jgi:hypothetical protein
LLHGSLLDGTIPHPPEATIAGAPMRFQGRAMNMQLFVHRQNVLFFQKQLSGELTGPRRQQLLTLLAEEEAKSQGAQGALSPVSPGAILAMR